MPIKLDTTVTMEKKIGKVVPNRVGRTILVNSESTNAVVRGGRLTRMVAKMETAGLRVHEPRISIVHSYIPKNTAPPAEIHMVLGMTPANRARIPSERYIRRSRSRGDG
jgi:hypothetical protein